MSFFAAFIAFAKDNNQCPLMNKKDLDKIVDKEFFTGRYADDDVVKSFARVYITDQNGKVLDVIYVEIV